MMFKLSGVRGLAAILFLAGPILVGCGPDSSPLGDALAAFRQGDRAQFLVAKKEAEDAIKTAVQPGDDLCYVNTADIAKYNARYVIGKLDDPALFRVSEEERLLYALKVAGHHATVRQGSFLARAPLLNFQSRRSEQVVCEGDKVHQRLGQDSGYMQMDDRARLGVLEGWISDMKDKYGADTDRVMRSAEAHLSVVGYASRWPVDLYQD